MAALLSHNVYLILTGRFDEGIAANVRALELDPFGPFTSVNLGWSYFMGRRHDEVFLRVTPQLDSLREDPRVQELVRRMDFPP